MSAKKKILTSHTQILFCFRFFIFYSLGQKKFLEGNFDFLMIVYEFRFIFFLSMRKLRNFLVNFFHAIFSPILLKNQRKYLFIFFFQNIFLRNFLNFYFAEFDWNLEIWSGNNGFLTFFLKRKKKWNFWEINIDIFCPQGVKALVFTGEGSNPSIIKLFFFFLLEIRRNCEYIDSRFVELST